MPQLEQAGNFRGPVISYGLNKVESGAQSVYLTVRIEEIWYEGEWCDYREHQLEVSGDIWIVKKDGSINERQVRSLIDYAGWDGSLLSICDQSWCPPPVQITVGEDEYQGNVRYRINWLNHYDRMPGGGNVSAEEAKELQARYGAQLRALSGNATRNAAAPPPGAPAKPPGKKKVAKEATAPAASPSPPAADEHDDVPF